MAKGHKFATQDSAGGFLNRRFKLSFWVLLGQRPKVPRARKREIPFGRKIKDFSPISRKENRLGKIIAVASGKGGTGKTSFTACVGLSLAAMGYETLALDCDITLRNLDLALGLSDSAAMDFSDVLEGRCTLEEAAVRHRKYPKLSLLAAPLAPVGARFSQTAMQALGEAIRQQYDHCLIDAPAGLGEGFQLATAIADSVIVVTTTDPAALRDAQRTVMELRRFPAGQVHLVVNRVRKKMLKALHSTIDDAMDTAGLPLLGVIPEDGDIPLALNQGIPLRDMNYYAQRAYENIARRITGARVPLMRARW